MKDSNPYQLWHRMKDNCLLALSDLTLIASKCPNEKLQQIFNEASLRELLQYIFLSDRSEKDSKGRMPDIKLASVFVNIGIQTCIYEYEKWNRDTPETSKPTIDHLHQTMAICKEIGYKATLNLIEQEHRVKNLKYICIWEEIERKNKDKFKNYVLNNVEYETNDPSSVFQVLLKKSTANEKEFHVFETPPIPLDYESARSSELVDFICIVKININPIENKGKIVFYNNENEEIKSKNITIKKYGSQTALFS